MLTDHAFDKLRSIDLSLAEFELLLENGVIIEETAVDEQAVKELVLLVEWNRPLHVVIVVDETRLEERILTVYEPDSIEVAKKLDALFDQLLSSGAELAQTHWDTQQAA